MEVVAPLLGELGRAVCAAVASKSFGFCCGPCVGEYAGGSVCECIGVLCGSLQDTQSLHTVLWVAA
jgi:hypothetical protein